MRNRIKYRKFVLSALIASGGAAIAVFIIVYVTTSLGVLDNSGLKASANDPFDNALNSALIIGFHGLWLGPLLMSIRGFFAGSLIMLLPFGMPIMLSLLAGDFLSAGTFLVLALVVGLIARIAANFAARSDASG